MCHFPTWTTSSHLGPASWDLPSILRNVTGSPRFADSKSHLARGPDPLTLTKRIAVFGFEIDDDENDNDLVVSLASDE